MTYLSKSAFANEWGHDALCMWPYRPCHVVCDHIILWESCKFTHPLAERLWTLSLDGAQDDECGEAEYSGWFALFRAERAIIREESDGYVTVATYITADEMERDWAVALETAAYGY